MPPVSTPSSTIEPDSAAADPIPRDAVPKHIAIIMDGNGRWAEAQRLPRLAGHKAGAEAVRHVLEAAGELGVEQVTLYCFSSENWKRPDDEVNELMRMYVHHLVAERELLKKHGIRLAQIGRRDGLPTEALEELASTEGQTKPGTRTLAIAVNYGGRQEITDAVREIAHKVKAGTLDPNDINEQTVSDHLYTRGMPDPDLVIRTAGEMRISNFLLWQISYAELYVTPTLWPDFDGDSLHDAVREYVRRHRRFGGLGKES